MPIRYDSDDSVSYILGTFYLSVDLSQNKTENIKSICGVFFPQAKIEKISRPDVMSLTSAERKSKEAKRN